MPKLNCVVKFGGTEVRLYRAFGEPDADLIGRAVKRAYGKRAFVQWDSEIPDYGQIFMAVDPTKNGGVYGNSITGKLVFYIEDNE